MLWTSRKNDDNELNSVDSGSWFHTLITCSEKNTALDLYVQISFMKFERMAKSQGSTQKVISLGYFEHCTTLNERRHIDRSVQKQAIKIAVGHHVQ